MTCNRAKMLIKKELVKRGLAYERLSAQTVSFSDLARGGCVFVRVHGWTPDPSFEALEAVARQHGFRVEAL